MRLTFAFQIVSRLGKIFAERVKNFCSRVDHQKIRTWNSYNLATDAHIILFTSESDKLINNIFTYCLQYMGSRSITLSKLPVNYVHSTILDLANQLTNKPKLRVE